MRYFSKAIPTRQLMTPRGQPVPFDKIDDRQPALIATEDGYLIGELLNSIAAGRGGIAEVTELAYAEFVKKKQAQQSQSPPPPRGLQGLLQSRPQRQAKSAAVAAVDNPPAPNIEKPPRVEIATQFPKLGRWRDPTTA